MSNLNKCCNKTILCFAWKLIKTQWSPGGIRSAEIFMVQILYHSVPTFVSQKLKVMGLKKKDVVQDIKTLAKNFNLPDIWLLKTKRHL